MRQFDVFNGDADGICALLQLRLAYPCDSVLISGVKRDIGLLRQVNVAAGDQVSVLDVSLDKNRQALLQLLDTGAEVLYVDHHHPGQIPSHPRLTTVIDIRAEICTSLLMDGYLHQRYSSWAVVGAFGDNLDTPAAGLANKLNLTDAQISASRELGICINYNAYGSSLDDLYFHPQELYRLLSQYRSPWQFIAEQAETFQRLREGYRQDMTQAWNLSPHHQTSYTVAYILPDAKWARRVSGVWSNELANRDPQRAHAVLSDLGDGGFQVSVRAPLSNRTGADELCLGFPGGGGRKAAAGINRLEHSELVRFMAALDRQYSSD